jgi:hypothetical protein
MAICLDVLHVLSQINCVRLLKTPIDLLLQPKTESFSSRLDSCLDWRIGDLLSVLFKFAVQSHGSERNRIYEVYEIAE